MPSYTLWVRKGTNEVFRGTEPHSGHLARYERITVREVKRVDARLPDRNGNGLPKFTPEADPPRRRIIDARPHDHRILSTGRERSMG